jgi:hypothetical protein
MRSGGARRFAALAMAAALAAGCGTTAESSAPTPAVELTGRVRQSNLDQSLSSIRVQLLNEGTEPVDVEEVLLQVSPFPDVASDDDGVVPPGRRIDFRVEYGDPTTCAGDSPTPGPATAQVVADGRQVEVDVEDSQNVLRRLLTLYCDRQRLAEVVTISLGERWTPADGADALLGTIELHRVAGDAEVTVRHLAGSVVYQLRPATSGEPIAVLAAGQDAISVPVLATALRCDPHALAEGKKNYVFPVWLGLAGGPEEVKVELTAELEVRPTFDTLCPAPVATGVGS